MLMRKESLGKILSFLCWMYIQIIMSKRPFNKIRRIEKKENIEEAEDNREELKIEQNIERENSGRPKLSVEKKKIKVSGTEPIKNAEDNAEPQPKFALGSKPNLFKGKREGNKLIMNNNRNSNQDPPPPPQESYAEAPKPTPLVIKKRLNMEPKRERENIVIQEEEPNQKFDAEDSQNFNVDESNTFKRRPDLKIKRFLQKRQPSERLNEVDESGSYNNQIQPQRQEYIPVPIQYREISIQPSAASVSQGKLDKQRIRSAELSQLLNLEMDLYEPLLTIGNVTPYEIYINKIKGGFLKNSNDQSFDDKTSNSCQTASLEYSDFTNQCPQDYSLDANRIERLDSNALFEQFILKVAPVVEELIKPTDLVTQPPIFLLAFRPSFKAFLKCPNPLFLYRSEEFQLDLLVVGEKLYITEGEITSVLMLGRSIVAGLKNGHLAFWNGDNNKSSRLYETIREFTQTTNFELPSFTTHHLQRFSSFASQFSIVSLLKLQKQQFMSLDATGKQVRWGVEEVGNAQELRPASVIELRSLTQHWALEAYSLRQRGDSLYISTSVGILCLHDQELRQRLDVQGVRVTVFEVPKKSPLVYAVSEGNTLLIYNQLYSHRLFQMSLQTGGETIQQIIIPQIEHENRELLYLFVIYLVDSAGRTYEIRLLENKFEAVKVAGDDGDGQRGDKAVIFRGVSRVGQSLQTVKLMRDLKVSTSLSKMAVNTDKSIPNLKAILEKNRQLMTMLQHENVMIA